MSDSFEEMIRDREAAAERLQAQLDTEGNRFGSADDRWWSPTVDKSGSGAAVIRFLPPPKGEKKPYVRWYDHGFKGPGGWYIEKNRQSLPGEPPDPVSEMNTRLWAQGENSEGRKRVSGDGTKQNPGTKRRLHYAANILVIEDPENSKNNGKVFLYNFGKRIMEKLEDQMKPTLKSRAKVNPFDPVAGANFELIIKNVDGQRNYNSSQFKDPSPITSDMDELRRIWESEHSLADLVSEDKFKSYEALKEKLDRVLGSTLSPTARTAADEVEPDDEPVARARMAPAPAREQAPDPEDVNHGDSSDDADLVNFFKKLK